MRRYIFTVILTAVLCSSAVLAQEKNRPDRKAMGEAKAGMQLRRQQLELEKMESEMAFEHEMRQLELESRRIEIERNVPRPRPHCGRQSKCNWKPFALLCMVVNLLLTIWVFMDVRSRKTASGIWIVITLLAGFFGALVYAVVRQGDMKANE